MSRPTSGLAGIAPVGRGTELTPAPDLARIASAAQAIKSQKQTDAQDKLRMALDLIDKGIIPEQKDWDKLLEGVGFSPELVDTINTGGEVPAAALPAGINPAQITAAGNAIQGNAAGAQAANPPNAQAARRAPGGGVTTTQVLPEGTGTIERAIANPPAAESLGALTQTSEQAVVANPQTVRQLRARGGLDALSQRTLDRIDRDVTDQEQAAQLKSLVHNLTVQASSGDPAVAAQAEGRLMRMGALQWTADRSQWNLMTDADKQASIEIALGNETPAQRINRESNIAQNLFTSGRFETYGDAAAVARGERPAHPMLPDVGRMSQEAEFYSILRNVGFSGPQAKQAALQMANGVPIGDAVPEGVRSVVEEELQMRQYALTLNEAQVRQAQERLDLDWWSARKNAALDEAALTLQMESGTIDDLFDRIDGIVSMHREGIDIDTDVLDALVNEVATRTGLLPERVNGVLASWGFVDRFNYTPYISSQQEEMGSSAAGATQQPSAELERAARGLTLFGAEYKGPPPGPGRPMPNPQGGQSLGEIFDQIQQGVPPEQRVRRPGR